MIPEISVDTQFIEKSGPFNLGIISAMVSIEVSSPELLSLIRSTSDSIASGYQLHEVNKIGNIAHTRNAYKSLGNDPNRYRPSADALIRRIVRGMGIYRINNVVDVLNLTSIRDGFSISGFNSRTIRGNISLGIGETGEPYWGIGRGELNITNLPVLRDEGGAFGSPTSDSERSMINPETTEILFVFYDFGSDPSLEGSLNDCLDLLKKYCRAKDYAIEVMNFS